MTIGAVVLAVLVVTAAFAITKVRQAELLDARRLAKHSRETLMLVNRRELASRELRTGGDAADRDADTSQRAATRSMVDSLGDIMGDDPMEPALMGELRGNIALWEAGQGVRTGSGGNPLYERVRGSLVAVIRHAERRYESSESAALAALWMMLAVILVSIAMLLGVATYMRRTMLRQVMVTATQAAELARANAELRVHAQSKEAANTELELFARTLQEQTVALEEQAADLEAANKRFEQSHAEVASANGELSALLAAISDVIVVYDRDGQYLKVTRAHLHEAMGEVSQRLGRHVHDLIPRESADQTVALVRAALDSGEARSDLIPVHFPDGTTWFDATAVPLDRGRVMYVARDVTERKRVERALREREERYLMLAQATNEILFEVDLATRSVQWNDALDTLGCRSDEVSTIDDWAARIHPEDAERTTAKVEKALEGTAGSWTHEYRWRRGDGRYATVLSRALVKRDSDGAARYIIGSMLDLSERQALESQLRQAQKMDAVGQLAGGVAHDFNNLLTVITSYAAMTLEEDRLAADDREALQEIAAAARRAADLTRQLLTFSRQRVYTPAVVDLNRTVGDAEKLLRRLLPASIELQITRAGDSCTVLGDEQQLGQVLINLAVNARDAMPEGGRLTITISCTTLDEPLGLGDTTFAPGRYATIMVADTGCGMSRDVQDRLFEPFFTTKAVGEGTGLGLAVVYGIVRQFEGRITVYSEPGLGTAIKIYIPETTEIAPELVREVARDVSGSETVLVVDDDVAVRRVVVRALERAGYRVMEAADGQSALSMLDSGDVAPALVISDLIMPGIGGKELVAELEARRRTERVLLMSGYSQERVVNAPWLADVAFVEKPFTADGLLRRVRDVLDAPVAAARSARGGRLT